MCDSRRHIIRTAFQYKGNSYIFLDWNAKYDTFAEAYGAADCVVTGKVKSLNTYEYNQVVFTEALLDTTEVFKGSPEGDIRVLFTGGVLNNTEYKAKKSVLPGDRDTFFYFNSAERITWDTVAVGGTGCSG